MTTRKATTMTRRSLLIAGAAVPLCGILTRRASAAEFTYKLATGKIAQVAINTHPAARFRHSMTMRRVKG